MEEVRIIDLKESILADNDADADKLREELGLEGGKKTTDDLNFTVETVSCLGACGLAPAMTVNGVVHPAMTPEKASELIKELRAELEKGGDAQ